MKEQIGAIADCEAIVQNIWGKFETKEQALVLSAFVGLVKLVIMFESVHIIVEEGTVEVRKSSFCSHGRGVSSKPRSRRWCCRRSQGS
jgi:hypothetical protein